MIECSHIPSSPGIYRISFEDKSYIGAAIDMRVRLQKHKSYLHHGKHSNIHMQRVYNLHKGALLVETLEVLNTCDREALLDRETFYHKNTILLIMDLIMIIQEG
jgi:excinuclease UvrABC nuclease subunit